MTTLETHYSARDIESRILAGIRAAGLDPEKRLTPQDLASLDHFHTGGLGASSALLELAKINADDKVLDVGAGLAGCARFLTTETGCTVECVEMSGDYCIGARLLNQITGLEDKVFIKQGSALELDYPDACFDVVWMQNVGMNIEDKRKLYQEIARVLKPAGRFAFQEVMAGQTDTTYYPLPWATNASQNFLITVDELSALLNACGLVEEKFIDISDAQPTQNTASSTPAAAGQLGLGVFVENLGEKAGNARRSLDEGQIRYVRAIYRHG